jgi:hypothetical protein
MVNDLTTTNDGDTVEHVTGTVLVDTATAAALARTEIDSQIATARAYPRSIRTATANILELATLDEETAAECIYELKRGGKKIRGPSIRLAEIIASQWGNCRDAAQVVSVDRVNKVVVAEGAFHDLETNRGTRTSCQRRISDKDGKIYSHDMIVVTGNAACAIARRNAILSGVPKGIWRPVIAACEKVIAGKAATLVKRRADAVDALGQYQITPEQLFKLVGVKGVEDIGLDELVSLRVTYASLKNGDITVEELLRPIEPEKPRVSASTADLSPPAAFGSGVPVANATPAGEPVASTLPDSVGAHPAPEAAASPAAPSTNQPSLFGDAPQREQQPDEDGVLDDLDVVMRDLITRLKQAAGDMRAIDAVVRETQQDFETLDDERRKKVTAAHKAAKDATSKKVA